jgi:hypothetical protein
MNKAERNDILDQHRQVYDGFVTTYGQQINQQPLYVQDYANDKGGITVNNKGEVKSYTNMRINEMRYDDMDTGLFSEEQDDYSYLTPTEEEFIGQDMIGDGDDDFEYGTMDEPFFMEMDEDDEYFEEDSYLDNEDIDEDMVEPLQEQVNKTLDMFKRFKKY